MKFLIFILILSFFFITGIAYSEDEYWGNIEHGSSRKIGDFEYYEDGTSSQVIGNHKFYSDGTSENSIGDFTFRSDGEHSTKIGNHTFRSDGNDGTDIGDFHYYDGKSVQSIDGFKCTSE